MKCPICVEYGDLVLVRTKNKGIDILVCRECDTAWKKINDNWEILSDFYDFLKSENLKPAWDSVEVIGRMNNLG